jgi:hypothetical protein
MYQRLRAGSIASAPRESWLNDLLSPLAMKYGRGVGETTAGAPKPGRRAEHLEKDIWICWVLHGVFGMPGRLPMAFKGGTSLSKVYGAIRRFSLVLQVRVGHSSSG